MTHSYAISNITCSGCIAKVKNNLLLNPDILEANVSIESPQATITMQKHLTVSELQQIIGDDSKYRISELKTETYHSEKTDHESWFKTYKPLLLIFGFITVVSLIAAKGNAIDSMNYFMSGFFLVFSFFKLLDLKGFASSYAMYDLLAAKVPGYGFVYPFIELALGFAFLTGIQPDLVNGLTILVMSFSSIGVIKSVLNKQRIKCACLGAVFNLPMSTVTIIEDLLMVIMSLTMLILSH